MSDQPRVSIAPAVWSVVLGVLFSPVSLIVMGLVLIVVANPAGGLSNASDRTWGAIFFGLHVAAVLAAMILGVISIVRSSRARSSPGSRAALTLGVIGTVIGTLSGVFYAYVAANLR
jgi:hypothetical protein